MLTWGTLMGPLADGEVDSDPAPVELLVGHGRSGPLSILNVHHIKSKIKRY